MCNCSSSCECSSTVLPIGPAGEDGLFGGYSGEWQYNTATNTTGIATPQLRFNNATSASVTEIYVFDTGVGTTDYGAFLDSFSNSSNFGYIRVFKEYDSTKYWTGRVTAVTDNGTYHTLTVTYLSASNATLPTNIFSAGDNIVLSFAPSGGTGTNVLYNTMTPVTNNGAIAILQTYTMPANQLSANGDYIEIVGLFSADPTAISPNPKGIDVRIGGTVCHTKVTLFPMAAGVAYTQLYIRATRQSATTLFLDIKSVCSNGLYFDVTGGASFFETGFSVSNLTSNTTAIDLRGQNGITAEQMKVTYFKKS